MSMRSPQSSSLVERVRRHWLLVAIAGLTFVALWAGQPAQAADVQPNVNQTVPPATPRPEVPPPDNKDKKDNKEDENKPAEAPAAAPAAAQGASSIVANNQESDGASVTVSSVTSAGDGWVVIHADDGGKPGAVLGHTAVPAGTTDNVIVLLDPPLTASGQLWAMLHVDAGTVGTYEFPGADAPAMDNGNIVVAPFTVTITGATAAAPEATAEAAAAVTPEATVEATVEATAEATPEATTEATAEATPEATTEAIAEATAETAAAAAEATVEPSAPAGAEAVATAEQTPESLPATGGETSLSLLAGVAGAALLMLAGAAFVTRRSA